MRSNSTLDSPSTIASAAEDQPPTEWSCLEALPGLIALPGVWRARLGGTFERMKALILRDSPNAAQLFPVRAAAGWPTRLSAARMARWRPTVTATRPGPRKSR